MDKADKKTKKTKPAVAPTSSAPKKPVASKSTRKTAPAKKSVSAAPATKKATKAPSRKVATKPTKPKAPAKPLPAKVSPTKKATSRKTPSKNSAKTSTPKRPTPAELAAKLRSAPAKPKKQPIDPKTPAKPLATTQAPAQPQPNPSRPPYLPIPQIDKPKVAVPNRILKPTGAPRFSQADLDEFRDKLLKRRREVLEQIRKQRGNALEKQEHQNIEEEDGSDASGQTVAFKLTDAMTQQLASVDRALDSIDKGTYGVCKSCGNLVRKVRLLALPFTPYCIHCANEREKKGRR